MRTLASIRRDELKAELTPTPQSRGDCGCVVEVGDELENTRASVVLVSRNEGRELHETILSLWDESGVHEVIVLDDASTDGSVAKLENAYLSGLPPLITTRVERAVGCNLGRNLGARLASGNVLIFLDAHMRVSGQVLRRLAAQALEVNGIVQAASRDITLTSTMLAFGCSWNHTPKEDIPFALKWIGGENGKGLRRVGGLMGACYAIPTEIFNRLGGFMETPGLWGYGEETMSMEAALCDVPIFCSAEHSARHWYRDRIDQPFGIPDDDVWMPRYAGLKIVLEDDTFRTLMARLRDRYWSERVAKMLAGDQVQAEHEAFQAIRQHDDRWFFDKHVPEMSEELGWN